MCQFKTEIAFDNFVDSSYFTNQFEEMKLLLLLSVIFGTLLLCINGNVMDSNSVLTTTPPATQSRFLLHEIRQKMKNLGGPSNNLINAVPNYPTETLAQKMKRMRCERLARILPLLRGLRLKFYNKYCLVADPTNLPPKDYDYA